MKTACKQIRKGAGTNIAIHVAFPLQRKQRSVCCNASLYSSICVFVSSKCSDAVKKCDTSPWIRECAGESGSKRGGFTWPGNGRFKVSYGKTLTVCRTCVTYRLSGESAHCRVSVAQWWSIGEQNSVVWGSIHHGDSNFTSSQVRDKTERHYVILPIPLPWYFGSSFCYRHVYCLANQFKYFYLHNCVMLQWQWWLKSVLLNSEWDKYPSSSRATGKTSWASTLEVNVHISSSMKQSVSVIGFGNQNRSFNLSIFCLGIDL